MAAAPRAPRGQRKHQVDLQLVLAVDASGSVNMPRFNLQMQGYAAAFRNPRVLNAIRSGISQAIAVTMIQWTGPRLQIDVGALDGGQGRSLRGGACRRHRGDAAPAVQRRHLDQRRHRLCAADLLAQSPFTATRRTIDVSGDGANNIGRPASIARDEAVRDGITINGLPILSVEPDLDTYYFQNVIGGPGAIMVPADSYESFGEAILKKLIQEIASNDAGAGNAPLP